MSVLMHNTKFIVLVPAFSPGGNNQVGIRQHALMVPAEYRGQARTDHIVDRFPTAIAYGKPGHGTLHVTQWVGIGDRLNRWIFSHELEAAK
jgi:hypothetical protein